MNCKQTQDRLSAYVDRELSSPEMLQVREHLFACRQCQEEELEYRCLKQLLVSGPTPEPTVDFEGRLVKSVLGPDPVLRAERKRPAYLVAAFAAAAAMAATLLILPFVKGNPAMKRPMANSGKSNDFAIEINRDQIYEASGDPLSGGHLSSPAVYGR